MIALTYNKGAGFMALWNLDGKNQDRDNIVPNRWDPLQQLEIFEEKEWGQSCPT